MKFLTQKTDSQARLYLPIHFANSKVIIEQVSNSELRIKKIQNTSEDGLSFREEIVFPLTDQDRDLFLAMLENPAPPSEVLEKAVKAYLSRK